MPKRILSFLLGLVLGSTGCKGDPQSASKTHVFPGGESVRIAATSVNDTSIKWAARAVGWETKRGYVLSMTVGARPAVVLEDFSEAEEVPTLAALQRLVEGVRGYR